MFGVVLTLLITATAIAITYSQMGNVELKLQAAVDSAVLAAVNLEDSDTLDPIQRKQIAEDQFYANLAGSDVNYVAPDVHVSNTDGVFTATVEGSARVDHAFSVMMPNSFSYVNVSAQAQSATDDPKHVNLFFLVDNSASMGIGQTAADQMDMLNDSGVWGATGSGACAVACHQPGSDTYTYYKSVGVRLRIDAIRDALLGFLSDMNTHPAETANTELSIALSSERYTSDLHDFETSLAAAITEANSYALGTGSGQDNTNIAGFLNGVSDAIVDIGDGSAADEPEVYVILMTDGIDNFWWQDASNHDWEAILSGNTMPDPAQPDMQLQTMENSWCTSLKNRGVNIIVMNVEYVVPEYQSWGGSIIHYLDIPDADEVARIQAVLDLVVDVEDPMRQCASNDESFFNVLSESSMHDAFDEIFAGIFSSTPRLTQ